MKKNTAKEYIRRLEDGRLQAVPALPVCDRCRYGEHERCRISNCYCPPCEAPHREPARVRR